MLKLRNLLMHYNLNNLVFMPAMPHTPNNVLQSKVG